MTALGLDIPRAFFHLQREFALCARYSSSNACSTDCHDFTFGLVRESFLQDTGKTILTAWYPSSVVLPKDLLAVANQFRDVGNRHPFLEQNANECMSEFVGMRGRVPWSSKLENPFQALVPPYITKLFSVTCIAGGEDHRAMSFLPCAQALDKPIRNPCEQGSFSLMHAQEDVIPLETLPDVECRYVGYA